MSIFGKIWDWVLRLFDSGIEDIDYEVVPKKVIKRNDINRYNKAIKNGNCCWAKTKGFTIK